MKSILSAPQLPAQGIRAVRPRRATYVRLLALTVVVLIMSVTAKGVSAQTCPHIPNGGGESMQAWITVKNTGAPVADGAVVPAGTQLRLDSIATAFGWCTGRAWGQGNECVNTGYTYERTINHTDVWVDVSTATSLNGTYMAGYVVGKNPDGITADWHVLDTTAPNSSGPAYQSLPYPGVYRFHFRAVINKTPCNMLPDRTETVTITVYASERDDNGNNGPTSCQTEVGEPINVTNGNMYVQQTDYSLPGAGGGLRVTRTYNSQGQNKRVGLFGNGWSSELDESVKAYGSLSLSLNLSDGRAVFFSRPSESAPYTPRAAPDFHAQILRNADNSYTLTLKDGSVHQFNASGKLLSKTDRNGNQLALTYDANGRAVAVTDAAGRMLTLTYGSYNLVSSITDQTGTVATYTYAYGSYGVLRSVTYADGSKYTFAETAIGNAFYLTTVRDALNNVLEAHTYDSQGRALKSERHGGVERYTLSYVGAAETHVTDALGRVTRYFFDRSRGRNVVTRVEGDCGCGGGGRTHAWAYDEQLNLTSETDALGQTITYTYDADGNRLTVTNALGTTFYTYNGFGQVLTVTDPMGGVTTNTYDARGNLLTTKDALNQTTSLAYDGRGLPLSVTDARNNITSFAYDAAGNLIARTDALNQTTTLAHDARGRLSGVTDAANRAHGFTYDMAGRLKSVTLPDSSTVTYTYDLAGRRTKVTDPRGNSTNYTYDTAYRVTSVKDAANNPTSYAYDLMSNLTGVTDALGRVTNYTYDDLDRLIKITYPEASAGAGRLEESFAYDAAGNLTRRTDRAGRATAYAYDTSGRLVSVTDPAQKVTNFEYDARSQHTAVIDALNQRYEFDYDALGRVTQTRRGDDSMSFLYDGVGNRTRRTDYNGVVTNYTYDALDRLTLISYPNGSAAAYGYDSLSRLATATNESGTVTISYDNRGRVSTVLDVWGQAVGYAYDANGNRTGLSLGASSYATYQYDNLDRLTQLTGPAGAAFAFGYDAISRLTSRTSPNGVATTFQYDGLDRLTRLKHAKGATTLADYQYQLNTVGNITQIVEPAGAHSYGYDALDRLISATHPTQPAESYTYDEVGNRTASHLATNYGYQPVNRLMTAGPSSYNYDSNGNLTSKSDASGSWLYAWDYENRLVQVTRPDGQAVTYKYDALGRRVERSNGGAWTRYSYDGEDVVLDAGGGGGTVEYLNGLGIDEKLSLRVNGGSALYYVADQLGSTRALADSSGNIVESMSYDSFGGGAGGALTRYGYTGRELDPDTGLYYYRARWYDPQAGRFISEDPIGFGGGANWYAYVDNNPTNATDPRGLQARSDRNFGPNDRDPRTGCGYGIYSNRCRQPAPSAPRSPAEFGPETEVIKICFRNADIPGGSTAAFLFETYHAWIKTKSFEAGLGPANGGVPGSPRNYGDIYPDTTINDHTGQADQPGAVCVDVEVNKKCIENKFRIGTRYGQWNPPSNDCNTVTRDAVTECGGSWKQVLKALDARTPLTYPKLLNNNFKYGRLFP